MEKQLNKDEHNMDNVEQREYLVFSDAQFDLIYKHQKEIDVEFSEDEKNFKFI